MVVSNRIIKPTQ